MGGGGGGYREDGGCVFGECWRVDKFDWNTNDYLAQIYGSGGGGEGTDTGKI